MADDDPMEFSCSTLGGDGMIPPALLVGLGPFCDPSTHIRYVEDRLRREALAGFDVDHAISGDEMWRG